MPQLRNKQLLIDSDLDLNSNKLTEVTTGTAATDGVNLGQVEALITGLEWQDSALDYIVDNTAAPPTEVTGNRYVLSHDGGAPNAAWDGASAGDIVEFNGTTWDATTPTTGTFISVDDDTTLLYYWGGAAWTTKSFEATTVSDGTTIDLTLTTGDITAEVIANSLGEEFLEGLGVGTSGQVVTSDGAGGFTYASDSAAATEVVTRNAASVTSSDEDDAVTDIFGANDPRAETIPKIFVNGALVSVGDGVKTEDCYFAETGVPGTAIAFASLSGDEDLQWNGSIAGYQLDTSDEIEAHFTIA